MQTKSKLMVESQIRFPFRNLILTAILALIFNAIHAQSPTVFKDDGYRGNYINITQCIPNLHEYGFGDNISSCQIPSGWKLIFYEHKDYCGATFTVTGNFSNFSAKDWNDCISSVEVYYNGVLQGHSYNCSKTQNTAPDKKQYDGHPKD